MKKITFIAVLILLAASLNAQEIPVLQYSADFWRCNLTLNKENISSKNNYYFTFSYVGEDYQAFRSLTLKIDGKEYWLLFSNIVQDWSGVATETCKTKYLTSEIITALRNAKNIECRVDSVRNDNFLNTRHIQFSPLSNDVLASIKQFIR